MKKGIIFLTLLLAVSLVFTFAADNFKVKTLKDKPVHVPGEIIVKYKADAKAVETVNVASRYGLTLKRNSKKKGHFSLYKSANAEAVLKKLQNDPSVEYAELNTYAYALMVPNDNYYGYQWHMTRIGMEDAWNVSTGSGVVVAVVDTGVKQSLEDLASTNFVAGYNFVAGTTDPTDDEGHGSHVAGTIAQSTNNNLGVAGIAYNCSIMPVKVLNRRGTGTTTDIADGIIWAVDNGADVINLSLGSAGATTTMENAVNYAWNNNVVVVCAAGNDAVSTAFYPAAYTNAISVSATDSLDALASYSNYGTTIDICAPGGDSADNNGDGYADMILQNTFVRKDEGYYFYQGTSMASPHVAGVAALIKSVNPLLTNAQIRAILENTAEDIGANGWDQYFGHGIVDAYAAVLAAQ